MKIAVLDLCYATPDYMKGQPTFGDVLARWLARDLTEASLPVIDVVEGAPLPDIADYDGYVISGSDKGVYDEAPWMAPLRTFLLAAREARKPMLGICFGHQIMADVFGGKAEKVGDAVVGVRQFDLDGSRVSAHVWHQDQVTRVPAEARVIGFSAHCPVAALEYDWPGLSVQFHPEYSADFIGGFLRRCRGDLLGTEAADRAVAEIETGDVALDLFAARSARFFREALAG